MTLLELANVLVGVVLAGLAGYHLSRTTTAESLLEGTRARIETWAYDELGHPRSFWRGKLGDLLTCGFCLGFWLTAGAWAAWAWLVELHLPGDGLRPVVGHLLLVFAAAGVQARMHYGSNRDVMRALLADAQRRSLEG